MRPLQRLLALVARRWRGRPGRRRPRIVRRVHLRCPHSCELVEVDFLQDPASGPRTVLRCSGRPECPPTCDHACRTLPAALRGAADALLIFPAGTQGVPDEVD